MVVRVFECVCICTFFNLASAPCSEVTSLSDVSASRFLIFLFLSLSLSDVSVSSSFICAFLSLSLADVSASCAFVSGFGCTLRLAEPALADEATAEGVKVGIVAEDACSCSPLPAICLFSDVPEIRLPMPFLRSIIMLNIAALSIGD